MVRDERVKIIRQVLTGVSDADYERNPNAINGRIEQITIVGPGVSFDLDIKPTTYSGLSTQNILDVSVTGTSIYYPRVPAMDISGTEIVSTGSVYEKMVVADTLDFNAANLATGSSITVRVYYI